MFRILWTFTLAVALVSFDTVGFVVAPAVATSMEWSSPLSGDGENFAASVSADRLGSVYVAGQTYGVLGGFQAGIKDGFLGKFDSAGDLQWATQFGTTDYDYCTGVSADGLGSVYVSGTTGGNLTLAKAFIRKFDSAGNLQWVRQADLSNGQSVSADRLGNVYLSGLTQSSPDSQWDAFVDKYDSSGNLQWTRRMGSSDLDYSNGVIADGLGNVYITGPTFGNAGGTTAGGVDAFISKLDSAGDLLWSRQLGSAGADDSLSIAVDGLGCLYVAGFTSGDLGGPNAGGVSDAFLSKFSSEGDLQWSRQLGTPVDDSASGVSADELGNVFVVGTSYGPLGGASAGGYDVFLAQYNSAGDLLDLKQLGGAGNDLGSGVSVDEMGNVYLSGSAEANLPRPYRNFFDGFVTKFSYPIPEPSSWLLIAIAMTMSRKKRCAAWPNKA